MFWAVEESQKGMTYCIYCLNGLWMILHDLRDTWHDFDDATPWHVDKYICFIWWLIWGFHPSLRVFNSILWWWLRSYKAFMDRPMQRSHSGLDICMMALIVGGVDGVLATVVWAEWGCHGIATWLTQANTSIRLDIWYLMVLWYLKPICICFKCVYVL